jgi:hypothetical protein
MNKCHDANDLISHSLFSVGGEGEGEGEGVAGSNMQFTP